MIRLATPADLSQAADIYEEILDREAQGPVYTNWQRRCAWCCSTSSTVWTE